MNGAERREALRVLWLLRLLAVAATVAAAAQVLGGQVAS